MRAFAIIALEALLTACPAPRSPALDWSVPPAPHAAPRFVPPAIDQFALPNGMHVLLVENDRLPIATVLAIAGGAGSRGAPPGLAALTASLLGGSGIAAELESLGATLDIDIASDHATLALATLSDHSHSTFALLAEALRRPKFDDAEVAHARDERAAELALHAAQPRILAAQRFDRLVFGDHPYSVPAEGNAAAVAGYRADDLRAQWARGYGPTTTTLVVVGAISHDWLELVLNNTFGDWENPPPPPIAAPTADATPRLAYVDRPGASDVAIVIGRRVPPLARRQRLAADLANAVLQNRLTAQKRAIIGASFWRGQLGGTWSVATTVAAPSAAAMIRTIQQLVAELRTTDAPAAELAKARAATLRALPVAFESNAGIARVLQRIVVQELPLDHYATYADDLAAITPAAMRAAIAQLWDGLSIVVAGDWATLGPELSTLGLPLAP